MTSLSRLAAAASAVALVFCAAAPALAGQAPRAAAARNVPADPAPITGVWFTYQPEGFEFLPGPELTPAAKKLNDEYRALAAKGINQPTASGRCIPPGLPSLYNRVYPIQIVRTPTDIVMIHEYESQLRFIRMNEAKHPDRDDILPSFNGRSIGRWEGTTLVTDTISFKTKTGNFPTTLVGGVGISDDYRVVERWTVSEDGDLLTVNAVITDPAILAKPWSVMKRFKRRNDLHLEEYTCLQEENLIEVDAEGKEVFRNSGSD